MFALFQTLSHQNPCTHRSLIISLSTFSLFHVSLSASRFSLCFTSVSLPQFQVHLSLSLTPSSSAVNPFFYLIISHPRSPLSLLHVSFSPSVSGAPLSLSLSPLHIYFRCAFLSLPCIYIIIWAIIATDQHEMENILYIHCC